MKGFPNQIADFSKLAAGLAVAVELIAAGENPKDNGIYGEALVHAGVAGTGHNPQPVEQYLAEQAAKAAGDQGHRTAARGLRELYRMLGLIDDEGEELIVTPLGLQAAGFAGQALDARQITFWRTTLTNMVRTNMDGSSHPYQVLLRLVARRPGITRAKCALALEAHDDSTAELDRISELAVLDEADICAAIGVTQSNWNNAKKMLPRFAEQLGDVVKVGQNYVLADSPGFVASTRGANVAASPEPRPRAPRGARQVTHQSIAQAGISERTEPPVPPDLNPAEMLAAIETRLARLQRHNLIVRTLAVRLSQAGFVLYEDPFDILAVGEGAALLVEVKTLDGSAADERDRVRDALAQLLYYEAFVVAPLAAEVVTTKIACFETEPSAAHLDWLRGQGIASIWQQGEGFASDDYFDAPWLA